MTRSPAVPGGTLVRDGEGLAKAVLRDRTVTGWLALARADDLRVITSAATLVEVVHPRINRPALEWTLSRLVIEPITEPIARHAAVLLAEAGLHGHKYAIDAMLAATALAATGPVTVLTSDPEGLTALPPRCAARGPDARPRARAILARLSRLRGRAWGITARDAPSAGSGSACVSGWRAGR
ncbi:putative nucleic acid-binding protein [Streptomyces sp. PvR034]